MAGTMLVAMGIYKRGETKNLDHLSFWRLVGTLLPTFTPTLLPGSSSPLDELLDLPS